LAEEWDNVGLLVGDPDWAVERAMTCLTITRPVVAEAISKRANLIVTHHPMPFQSFKRITTESTTGKILLNLIQARVAVHSPHTAFDSALAGINQRLAEGLGLADIRPLRPLPAAEATGGGRHGRFSEQVTLAELVARAKRFLSIDHAQVVGDPHQTIKRVAVACGSGGSMLADAIKAGCEAIVLGETNFHTCLEAEAQNVSLVLTGHYASERFGVEYLAEVLAKRFPNIAFWASRHEIDPLRIV
jgi:dinuclear metal center YbgI/SA1388 family protein